VRSFRNCASLRAEFDELEVEAVAAAAAVEDVAEVTCMAAGASQANE
jgi:hypothetical protein